MQTSIASPESTSVDVTAERPQPLARDDLTTLLFGHAAFQFLHAGAALGVFELLASRREGLSLAQIGALANLESHPVRCLMFGLTALRLVVKVDDRFVNAGVVQELFESDQWMTFKDTIAFEAEIVYEGQADFVASLRENRNVGLRRVPGTGPDLYHRLSETPHLEQVFYRYMRSWSEMALPRLLKSVDFSRWRHIVDLGGGDATAAIAIAKAHPGVSLTLFELPTNAALPRRRVAQADLQKRITVVERDMFRAAFPTGADCFLFVHQLVIWPPDVIRELMIKAFAALRPGGAVVIFSSISDDSQDGPLMAALDTAYFVSIPATRGMIYSWNDYETALRAAGFIDVERFPCRDWSPHGAVVAIKPESVAFAAGHDASVVVQSA